MPGPLVLIPGPPGPGFAGLMDILNAEQQPLQLRAAPGGGEAAAGGEEQLQDVDGMDKYLVGVINEAPPMMLSSLCDC